MQATRFATIEAMTREQMLLKSEMDRLRSDISTLRAELQNAKEKSRTDLRYEVDKLTGQQRLDLNLEKGRVREELQKQSRKLQEQHAEVDDAPGKSTLDDAEMLRELDIRETQLLRFQQKWCWNRVQCVRAERARELCARGAPHFMRAAWWVGVHIVSVCFHLSWSLRGQVGHTVSCRGCRSLASAVCGGAGARSARGKTQQGGAQKVSPGANVFSWKFCTRTSRSRRLNRYG